MEKLKIGVVFGGMSTEHNVSISSGTAIIKNLDKSKYEVHPMYINEEGKWFLYTKPVEQIINLRVGDQITEIEPLKNELDYLRKMDLVFPVLHGLYGEDGTIQGMLELLDVKYVGCKVLSSSICMDKAYTKLVFDKAQIPQASYLYVLAKPNAQTVIHVDKHFNYETLTMEQIAEKVENELKLPVFIKPSNSGSSVGIAKAKTKQEVIDAILTAAQFDKKILIEEQVVGRELECAVLEREIIDASGTGEVLAAADFYTFDSKYTSATSRTVIPADILAEKEEEIRQIAIKAFQAVDGSGYARVDFFIREADNKVLINEINTIPGFTQTSMYPKLWEQKGLSFTKLLDKMVDTCIRE